MTLNYNGPRCACCIMPEAKGHITLGDDGVCSVCRDLQEKIAPSQSFDSKSPEEKLETLKKIVAPYKKGNRYDCAVSVSGGKDSIMTLYVAVRVLGLNPLAIIIDNGFALDEMYANVKNATDILGVDLMVFKTADLLKIFPQMIRSGKPIYYCRVCHALIDNAIRRIAHQNGIDLILGGYTKGQQYIRNSELFWIYKESDENAVELFQTMSGYEDYADLIHNQNKYFREHYGNMRLLSPFKYIEWNENKILDIITRELKFQLPKRSWPDKSSNCSFNYVAQYLTEKVFNYGQHEVELSELVRVGEMSRERALEIIHSPIEESDLEKPLEKMGLTVEDVYCYDKQ